MCSSRPVNSLFNTTPVNWRRAAGAPAASTSADLPAASPIAANSLLSLFVLLYAPRLCTGRGDMCD